MTDLFVNEVFYSIQGEGSFTGWPAVFIRLQGCSVRCFFCDTPYTWKAGPSCRLIPIETIFTKDREPHCARISDENLAQEIFSRFPSAPLIVITGGEPLEQNISNFCQILLDSGRIVSVETSGARSPKDLPESVFLTVSPKIHAKGGKLANGILSRANELKYVIGSHADIADMHSLVKGLDIPIFLQPMSMDSAATKLCIDEVCRQGGKFRLSLQTEKFANFR